MEMESLNELVFAAIFIMNMIMFMNTFGFEVIVDRRAYVDWYYCKLN